jgi:glycine dehydrogenase
MVTVAADLLALTLLTPPGEMGADIAVGTTQRFGVPVAFGGPHAGYMSVRQGLERSLPGRLVGVSKDADGAPAYRLALQTREQHIRREKATSNICTAQVLLAVIAGMYAVYHGPDGLAAIARRAHRYAVVLAAGLRGAEAVTVVHDAYFDTVMLRVAGRAREVMAAALEHGINLRLVDDDHVSITTDETTTRDDIAAVWAACGVDADADQLDSGSPDTLPTELRRESSYLTHPVFHAHRSETAMLRYLRRLADQDPARVVHDEAQRDRRDGGHHLAGVRVDPSVRPDRPGRGLRRAGSPARDVAGRDHRVRRRVAAAERRISGRARRAAGDPRLSPGER